MKIQQAINFNKLLALLLTISAIILVNPSFSEAFSLITGSSGNASLPAYRLSLPAVSSDAPIGFPKKPSSTPPVNPQSTGSDNSDFGYIVGKVVDVDTKEVIENAKITIPELKLSGISDRDGKLKFDSIYVGKNKESFVTIKVSAPGFGEHTMVDVGIFPGITATITLELKKGTTPTKWFGLLKPEERVRKLSASAEEILEVPKTSGYSSQTVLPPYIRIAIRATDPKGKPDPNGIVIRTDVVDFDFYIKHVLPQEWIASWPAESLKAGAMAVKEYGWYWVNKGGKYPQYNADLDNSQNSQVYNPNLSYSASDSAVNNTAANGWYQNGVIFQSEYCDGTYDSSYSCGTNKMAQWGSKYWADQGKTYQWILNYYYTPTPTYFTIIPQSPKTYVLSATTNSITLSFSSPGATWYQVNKWKNGSWNNVIYFGPNTSFTDTGLTLGQSYYYTAAAWNSAGWGLWSFNNGHIAAVAKSASNPPAPVTDTIFIAKNEIQLRAKSSDPNITYYYVIKWNGTSWKSIYYGSPPVLNPETSPTPPDKLLPNPYVDSRDRSFIYSDKNLSPSTLYYYAIAIYDPSLGWSDYTNYQGYISIVTQKTY